MLMEIPADSWNLKIPVLYTVCYNTVLSSCMVNMCNTNETILFHNGLRGSYTNNIQMVVPYSMVCHQCKEYPVSDMVENTYTCYVFIGINLWLRVFTHIY